MKYSDFLKTTKTGCNFCSLNANRVIKKGNKSYLTCSLAPYCKHHLLVIPDRHVEYYEELNKEEKEDIDEVLTSGIEYIKLLGHKGYSLLLRNGENTGKTMKHLHYHIIPSVEVGSLSGNSIDRKIMNEEEINQLLQEFKKFV